MYAFYPDQDIRDLNIQKVRCLQYVETFCKDNKILFNEIYLDNTYGINDPRNKVIPLILKSVLENLKTQLATPTILLTLVHVKDVVNHIYDTIKKSRSSSNLYLHPKTINLQSIYKHLCENNKIENVYRDHLEYSDNEYIESDKINLFEIQNSIETSKRPTTIVKK